MEGSSLGTVDFLSSAFLSQTAFRAAYIYRGSLCHLEPTELPLLAGEPQKDSAGPFPAGFPGFLTAFYALTFQGQSAGLTNEV